MAHRFFLPAHGHQAGENEQAVDDEQLVTELVAPQPLLRVRRQDIAERGDQHSNHRDCPAAVGRHLPLGEDAEHKESQQRSVGVGGHHKDDADERVVVVVGDNDDDHQEEQRDQDVHNAAHPQLCGRGRIAPLNAEDVVTYRRGKRSEGAVGGGETGRDEAEHKDHRARLAQIVEGNLGIDAVGGHLRDVDAIALREDQQHPTQRQEEDVDHHQYGGEGEHIAPGIPQRLAGQVFLHHILVKARHRDGDEHTADDLLEEEAVVVPVEIPDRTAVGAALARGGHPLPQVGERAAHIAHNHDDGDDQCPDQEGGLQQVGPHHRLDAAPHRVEQDDGDHHNGGEPDGDMPAVEDKHLQHKNNKIHTQGRAQQTGDKKEHRAGFVRLVAEAPAEVLVDGGNVQLIVQRQQQPADDYIAEHIAQHHTEVGKLGGIDIAGHRHKGHARKRAANHTVRHHKPRGFPVAREIGLIVGLSGGDAGNHKEHHHIEDKEGEYKAGHQLQNQKPGLPSSLNILRL